MTAAPWATLGAWLRHKLPERVDVERMLAEERFVDDTGRALRGDEPYRPHSFVWFHRDLRVEPPVPGEIEILHRDERLVVVDKPPFLSTIPRGRHVRQSVIVKMREQLALPDLSPAHRLDRVTSGVLVLVTQRRWRGAYQQLFQLRAVHKTYRALAPYRADLVLPTTVRDHLRKDRGSLQATRSATAPVNAETLIELDTVQGDQAIYRLTPQTGRTHQLRMHMWGLGIPIIADPLYPTILDVDIDDFSTPLQLIAHELAFRDPVDGREHVFTSGRRLPLSSEPRASDSRRVR